MHNLHECSFIPHIKFTEHIRRGGEEKGHLLEENLEALSSIWKGTYVVDTFQDYLIAGHVKPCKHVLEISISPLNHVIVRPTKTPKLGDKNWTSFLEIKCFINWSFQPKWQ